jgi:hypothetical protein
MIDVFEASYYAQLNEFFGVELFYGAIDLIYNKSIGKKFAMCCPFTGSTIIEHYVESGETTWWTNHDHLSLIWNIRTVMMEDNITLKEVSALPEMYQPEMINRAKYALNIINYILSNTTQEPVKA